MHIEFASPAQPMESCFGFFLIVISGVIIFLLGVAILLVHGMMQRHSNSDTSDNSFSWRGIRFTFTNGFGCVLLGLLAIIYGTSSYKCNNNFSQTEKTGKYFQDLVRVGGEYWTIGNVSWAYYNNGDSIPQAKDKEDWDKCNSKKIGCWCYYDFDAKNGKKFGLIYNWYALDDKRGFAPPGWHVASIGDYKKLVDPNDRLRYGYPKAFKYNDPTMADTCSWINFLSGISGHAHNHKTSRGLNPFLGGMCNDEFSFTGIGKESRWWTMSEGEHGPDSMYYFSISRDSVQWLPSTKNYGYYVRCVKDGTKFY